MPETEELEVDAVRLKLFSAFLFNGKHVARHCRNFQMFFLKVFVT